MRNEATDKTSANTTLELEDTLHHLQPIPDLEGHTPQINAPFPQASASFSQLCVVCVGCGACDGNKSDGNSSLKNSDVLRIDFNPNDMNGDVPAQLKKIIQAANADKDGIIHNIDVGNGVLFTGQKNLDGRVWGFISDPNFGKEQPQPGKINSALPAKDTPADTIPNGQKLVDANISQTESSHESDAIIQDHPHAAVLECIRQHKLKTHEGTQNSGEPITSAPNPNSSTAKAPTAKEKPVDESADPQNPDTETDRTGNITKDELTNTHQQIQAKLDTEVAGAAPQDPKPQSATIRPEPTILQNKTKSTDRTALENSAKSDSSLYNPPNATDNKRPTPEHIPEARSADEDLRLKNQPDQVDYEMAHPDTIPFHSQAKIAQTGKKSPDQAELKEQPKAYTPTEPVTKTNENKLSPPDTSSIKPSTNKNNPSNAVPADQLKSELPVHKPGKKPKTSSASLNSDIVKKEAKPMTQNVFISQLPASLDEQLTPEKIQREPASFQERLWPTERPINTTETKTADMAQQNDNQLTTKPDAPTGPEAKQSPSLEPSGIIFQSPDSNTPLDTTDLLSSLVQSKPSTANNPEAKTEARRDDEITKPNSHKKPAKSSNQIITLSTPDITIPPAAAGEKDNFESNRLVLLAIYYSSLVGNYDKKSISPRPMSQSGIEKSNNGKKVAKSERAVPAKIITTQNELSQYIANNQHIRSKKNNGISPTLLLSSKLFTKIRQAAYENNNHYLSNNETVITAEPDEKYTITLITDDENSEIMIFSLKELQFILSLIKKERKSTHGADYKSTNKVSQAKKYKLANLKTPQTAAEELLHQDTACPGQNFSYHDYLYYMLLLYCLYTLSGTSPATFNRTTSNETNSHNQPLSDIHFTHLIYASL